MALETIHDRYELLRPLARGGMAMVYLAREADTGREVALKQLALPEGARLAEWRLRFQQEFHTAARLKHPNLVETWDYAEGRDGVPFFTMEFLPGPGLEEMIPMPPARLTALLPGLLKALAYLHHQGLVHCDLKPENVRLGADGSLRLMDLGLITRAGQVAPGLQGTFPYLPPEVIRRAPIDRRSDLYALGAVLYHLLAGRPPYQGDPRAVLSGHLEGTPAPLSTACPEAGEALSALVHKLLEKDPLQRFQSADEVLRFLGEATDAEDDQTLFHPPLLGRAAEVAALDAALVRSRAGEASELWLTGEAGLGHQALVEEFCCRAQIAGAAVLRGAFHERMAPFEGLRGVVRALVATARAQSREIKHLTPVLARVLPELGTPAAPDSTDMQQEKVRLFDALGQLVAVGCASGPLVLAFTGAHHAEGAWREWLEYQRRNWPALPLLVVVAYTGDPELDLDPGREELALAPIARAESHEACRAILGQSDLDAAFTDEVHQLSGGYPQRIEALLRALLGGGQLARRNGEWVLPAPPLARALEAIDPEWALTEGLRALGDRARDMLDALLVRGRESALFDLAQTVRHLHELPEGDFDGPALFEALRALEEGGWVESAEGACRLAPGRDAADLLGRVGEARKSALHAAIASALEPRLATEGEDPVLLGELASHALAAEDARRGPRFALAAAQRSARLFDLEGAETLLAAALALLETVIELDGPLLLSLHRLRADVARLAGDRRVADQSYQRALALAEQLRDGEALCSLANGLGRLKVTTGQLDEAAGLFHSVLERLGEESPHVEAAHALTMLGRLALTRGDLGAASAWVQRALGLARGLDDRPLIRENMAQLGYLYVAGGDRATEGLGLLVEALQMTEKDEAKLELNACYALLGNAHLLLGRFVEAKLAFQRNCDLCAEIGAAPHDEATAFVRRSTVEMALGDYRGARRSATPAAALARMVGNKALMAQARLLDGLAALYQGDYLIYQDAVAWVEEAIADAKSDYLNAFWLTCRAEAEGFLGGWSQALSSANQALEAIAAGAGHEYAERARVVKAEALMRLGLYKPARQELDAMATPLSEALQARWLLAKARLERGDGKPAAARPLAERALALAQRAGVVPVAAECCLLLARLADDREEALSLSRKALLDAEVCGHPALEAEALHQASLAAPRAAQADYFITAAEDAWKRAIGSLTSTWVQSFGATDERRALKDALARREAEGYRLTAADQQTLLDMLALPPEPARLLSAVTALCQEASPFGRVALFWEGEGGRPALAHGAGAPLAPTAESELEAARARPDGVVLVPLGVPGETPWGAILVTGAVGEAGDRLRKLLPYLSGALWAARRLSTGPGPTLERVVPQQPTHPDPPAPAGWPSALS